MVRLRLVRGLPGSGKTTFAQGMEGFVAFEADQFFMQDGVYTYDPLKIKDAHAWCLASARAALAAGKNVVVANTFTRIFEMEPYLQLACEFGAIPEIFTVYGRYPNTHGVPDAIIQKMKDRWEPSEAILNATIHSSLEELR